MTILLDGTLGITTPALTVTGATVNTGGISTGGNLTFTSTGSRITGDFSTGTIANRVQIQSSTVNGQTGIIATPNGTSTNVQFEVNSDSSGGTNASVGQLALTSSEVRIVSGLRGTGSYLPLTMLVGGSERMRIDTSGNVGIGTSSPTAFGAGYTSLTLSGSASGIFQSLTTGNDSRFYGTSTATYFGNWSAVPLLFYTNSGERMRIDSAGNVAIGSSTAEAKLMVFGSGGAVGGANATNPSAIMINAGVSSVDAGNGLEFKTSVYGAGYGHQISGINVPGAGTALTFSNRQNSATWTEVMRIGTSGNVGIGTPAPSYNLHVNSNGGSGTLSLSPASTNGGASYILMGNSDSAGVSGPNVIISANRNLQFGVGTSFSAAGGGTFTQYMNINPSGLITTPKQPAVTAYKTNGGGWSNYAGIMVFDVALTNVGSCYNTSTGYFTCPVAGVYEVYAAILAGNSGGNGNVEIAKNGASWNLPGGHYNTNGTSLWFSTPTFGLVSCAANDTLSINVTASANSVYTTGGYCTMSIRLVG